jgi:endonuclease/exonuclease/phosphatase family metal-dependent hydrolase
LLSIVTLNLLNDLTYWTERAPLVLAELSRLQPDLIALQEISLPTNTVAWLADRLKGYSVHICPKKGRLGRLEGLAILSRLPVEEHHTLSLSVQGRVAHWITVPHQGNRWLFANTHMFWSPFDDYIRLHQVRRLLSSLPHHHYPTILCGDFNAMPYYRSIKLIKRQFTSAYAAVHGEEPDYTIPTPLKRGPGLRHSARRSSLKIIGRLTGRKSSWRGAVDYIFVSSQVQVVSCDIAFNQSPLHDHQIYPSDHLGLIARILIK